MGDRVLQSKGPASSRSMAMTVTVTTTMTAKFLDQWVRTRLYIIDGKSIPNPLKNPQPGCSELTRLVITFSNRKQSASKCILQDKILIYTHNITIDPQLEHKSDLIVKPPTGPKKAQWISQSQALHKAMERFWESTRIYLRLFFHSSLAPKATKMSFISKEELCPILNRIQHLEMELKEAKNFI
ncbi:hypothetical protein FACUT_5350 [Fusarium acutatum]|uniref:Uncharacterized protein n=1 Tax=Fusarium acutatum TaxID=78861 RepID=A0A8H4JTV2_9HYPO|nr:hypothetical protein FACUT_5350 [Fusarium acutatum]